MPEHVRSWRLRARIIEVAERSGPRELRLGRQMLTLSFRTLGMSGQLLKSTALCDAERRMTGASAVQSGRHAALPTRRQVFGRLRSLKVSDCPFVNLSEKHRSRWGEGLTAEDMKKCVWVKPALVAQIEFLEWKLNRIISGIRGCWPEGGQGPGERGQGTCWRSLSEYALC